MPRAIWTGTISFGLVTVPVKLYSAIDRKTVRFHQLSGKTGVRVAQKRVDPKSDEEVPYENIVKGFELAPDRYVVVKPEELDALQPQKTRTIEIEDFVELAEIDPVYFEKTYYVAPGEGKGNAKAYLLLLKSMEAAGKVAIGRFVMRTKEYLVTVRPFGGHALALETMFFPDEVRDLEDVPSLPAKGSVTAREREIADRLIDSLTRKWDPKRYHDTYRESVLKLIKRKAKGEDIVVEETEKPAPVTDLVAALEASLEAARGRKPKRSTRKSA
jgi:DNA end-binding protein Ku